MSCMLYNTTSEPLSITKKHEQLDHSCQGRTLASICDAAAPQLSREDASLYLWCSCTTAVKGGC